LYVTKPSGISFTVSDSHIITIYFHHHKRYNILLWIEKIKYLKDDDNDDDAEDDDDEY